MSLHSPSPIVCFVHQEIGIDHYVATCVHRPPLLISLWEKEQEFHQMLKFWNLILRLELTLFEFVKSLRTGNFHVYVDTLKSIVPWMFALDHHNYSRWLSVHLNEMCQLKIRNPNIYNEFL